MSNNLIDLTSLDGAMTKFFRTIKRPQYWQAIMENTGINLDRPSAGILLALHHSPSGGFKVLDLAKLLCIEAPSVTRKTQDLEDAKLITRSHQTDDKRVTYLTLTDLGKEKAQKIWKARQEVISNTVKDWSQSDKEKFSELFNKFSDDFADTFNKESEKGK
jgi:DNA-binding MarR family transcriptional regulator